MKIPGEDTNSGADRLTLYSEVIAACFHSRDRRIQQYEVLRHYYLHGCSPEADGTPYNKVEPIIDTLTAFLYSADSTRFSVHLSPETDKKEWDKVPPISRAINNEWLNSGADQIFGSGLEWATVYNTTLIKLVPNGGRLEPYVVDPHCFGVYREDVTGIDKQEAIAHRYYISRSQLEALIENHPQRAKIMASVMARPKQPRDELPEGLRRIIVTNMAGAAPLTPGGQVTGNGTLFLNERISYNPELMLDLVEMTELWIRDDELSDYRTVTLAEGPVVIFDRPNIFIEHEQPFTQICPMPMHGYFWGQSFAAKLIGLQSWRNIRMDEIQRMLALQAKPPTALTGWSGVVDELDFALNQPGGVLNSSDPMGKVERFAVPVPADLWADVQQIDEMFSEAAALPPLLMGRGETGVRSGRQTSELSRLGSSRIKKRALCVEDSLETFATKIFRALRKYDSTDYDTIPTTPGAKPMKFILKQAPEDATIRVDAHSNSPLFVEDQKDLAQGLFEAHAIERETLVEMLNPPMKDVILSRLPVIEAKEAAAAKAKAEQEMKMAQSKHAPTAPGAH